MILIPIGGLALGAVFATAGTAKLRDLPGSREAMRGFGVPSSLVVPVGLMVPLAELVVALAMLSGPTRTLGAVGGLVLLAGFSLAIAWNLARGRTPDCHCFGQLHSSPAGPRTLARNAALIAVASFVASQGDPVATAVAAAGGLAIAAAGLLLSRRAAPADSDGVTRGLAVGTTAPDFELPAIGGPSVSLRSLLERRRPALLLFSDPHCGPCQELAPHVVDWQRLHSADLTIAVIERSDGVPAGESDVHGRSNVLLQRETEIADAYGARGTPTAVLVGTDGRVASPVAGGSAGIEALMTETVPGFKPHPVESDGGSAWTVPVRLGGPLVRRELMVRGAVAGAVLSWPARAMGRGRAKAPPRCNRDRDCPGRSVCQAGRCRCPSIFPNRCAGDCTNFDADDQNCGGCGNPPCEPGTTCAGGRCITGNSTTCGDCGPGRICCEQGEGGGACVFPTINHVDCGGCEVNCGGCGIKCAPGELCCGGRCIDPKRDPDHCGECLQGRRCGPKQVCHAGRCRDECPKPLRQCGRTCGNPNTQICCHHKDVIDRDDID